MRPERIAEIEQMLDGYEAWRERWFSATGCRATVRPGEIALRELLAEVKSLPLVGGGGPSMEGGAETAS